MPHIGQKRRNSIEATCDSSQCAFCNQRSQRGLAAIQHTCSADSQPNSDASTPSDFSTWLQAQKNRVTAQEPIDFGKIGLPTSQLEDPPSKRTRQSIDVCEASSSDSSDPTPATFGSIEQADSVESMPSLRSTASGIPWLWSNEWAERPTPRPGALIEIGSFSAPDSRRNSVQHTADIVCGVEFSPDGKFLAAAGVAKQVCSLALLLCHHTLLRLINSSICAAAVRPQTCVNT